MLKELENCTVQLKKKSSELQQLKLKYDDVKARGRAFAMDSSD